MDLDFWFEFGSTYSYPTALRIEESNLLPCCLSVTTIATGFDGAPRVLWLLSI